MQKKQVSGSGSIYYASPVRINKLAVSDKNESFERFSFLAPLEFSASGLSLISLFSWPGT